MRNIVKLDSKIKIDILTISVTNSEQIVVSRIPTNVCHMVLFRIHETKLPEGK